MPSPASIGLIACFTEMNQTVLVGDFLIIETTQIIMTTWFARAAACPGCQESLGTQSARGPSPGDPRIVLGQRGSIQTQVEKPSKCIRDRSKSY